MPHHSVSFGSKTIRFRLQFSERKTLGISVLPDLTVVVTAPNSAADDLQKIKAIIKKRAPWILKQQGRFGKFLPRQPTRQYVSGESHWYLGRQYRLKLQKGSPESVKLDSGYFHVYVENKEDKAGVERLLQLWYNERAKIFFDKKVSESIENFKRYGIETPPVRLRKMSMRWGTCSPNGSINLNPELIKAPSACVEYVVVHELCHLIHPNHDQKFYQLLLRMMPDWKERKARLERIDT